jgi:3-oxocholest-4-en-26-oate---CoA ligase
VLMQQRSFDADEFFSVAARERVSLGVIVGDSFAKPMLRALDAAVERGTPYDTSSFGILASSGVMWSTEVKQQLLEHGNWVLADFLGSSEGSMGSSIMAKGLEAPTAKFTSNPTTKVFLEDPEGSGQWREVVSGSDEVGLVAAGGFVPLGYFKDPEKSQRTFRIVDGVPYSFPGDMAQVAADGSLILLGRGSNCINSGGEKIFPEEVEEAVKRHEAVVDCLVVGLPDDKFGQRVVAVASVSADVTGDDLIAFTKTVISSYKAPKQVVVVERVQRAPNGKADYGWARQAAVAALG